MDQRLFFPATERNRVPIGDRLKTVLPARGVVLELASGSGEHAVAFQQRFPGLRWQASDPNPDHRTSINSWIRHAGLDHVMPHALDLDVEQRPWDLPSHVTDDLKAMVCINLLHISPPTCTDAVLKESALLLPSGAPLVIYGPFMRNGAHTSASNAAFDQSLRERNHQWGLRELNQVTAIAAKAGFKTESVVSMPANNLSLVFQRT